METAKLVIDALVAFGTVAVAVLAIWGEWFRYKFAPPRVAIHINSRLGESTLFGDVRVMFYHLKVTNDREWQPARDCRVVLKAFSKRDPDGRFVLRPLPVPLQFVWAPSEMTGPVITLVREQILDFGLMREHENRFEPRFYATPSSFSGFVGPNQAVRYHLEIEAINFSSRAQVFEVEWDGNWSPLPEEMARSLHIREIPDHGAPK